MKLFSYLFFVLLSTSAMAQHSGDGAAAAGGAPPEANQFDFLVGQWQLDVTPKVSGLAAMIHGTPKLVGTWKAWRVMDGTALEDEMRIFDASGNPASATRTLRMYARGEGRWKVVGIDTYHGRSSESSAQQHGAEMQIDGHFTGGEGKQTLTRTRYFAISADAFRMQQDRSADNGQTWDEAVLTIDAKRTAATATP